MIYQTFNNGNKRWVLIDTSVKGGIIDNAKDPFPDVPKKEDLQKNESPKNQDSEKNNSAQDHEQKSDTKDGTGFFDSMFGID